MDTVGAISSSQGMGAMMGMSADSESDFSSFMYYMILTEDGAKHAGRIVKAVEEETKDMNCEVIFQSLLWICRRLAEAACSLILAEKIWMNF